MATYTITRAMGNSYSSASTTQNLVTGDTLVVTLTGLSSSGLLVVGGSSVLSPSVSQYIPISSTTQTLTFTATSTGSYLVTFFQLGSFKQAQVTGTITTSASIAIQGGAQRSQGDTITVNYSGPSGTLYYNSTHTSQYSAFNPQTGTLSGGSGSFTVTANQPLTNTGNPTASRGSLQFSLRQGSATTGLLTTSNTIQVFATPSTPSTITATNVGSTSLTVTASGQVSGTGSNFGNFEVSDPNGHPTNGPWNSSGTTFTGLASGTSFTFYARRVNGVAISSSSSAVSLSTTGATAVAPTMNASYGFISNGIGLFGNPSGSTNGTVQYEWERVSGGPGAYNNGFQTSANLGVGIRYSNGGEWLGSTWRVRARAVQGSSTVFSSYSTVTLPSAPTINAPSSVGEGATGSASVSMSGAGGKTLYWTLLPATDFESAVQQGSVSLNSSGSGTISISPFADQTTEGAETGTLKLYVMPTKNETYEFLGSDTFTINDFSTGAGSVTDFTSASASVANNASSNATVTVTGSGGSGGTAEFNVSNSTTAPTAGWTTGTVSAPRGTSRYFWARRRSGGEVRTSLVAIPYLSDAPTGSPSFGTPSPGTNLVGTYSGNVTVPITGTNAADQYRIVSSDYAPVYNSNYVSTSQTGVWALTFTGNQSAATIGATHLPSVAGASRIFKIQGRRLVTKGAEPRSNGTGKASRGEQNFPGHAQDWDDITGATLTITRDSSFTLTASPNPVTEGNSVTFTLGAPASLAAGTSVGFELSGVTTDDINLSSLTDSFTIPASGSATKVIGITSDSITEGDETITMTLDESSSLGIALGTVSASSVITGQTAGGTGPVTTGGGTGTFGIEIRNTNQNVILDSNMRVANFRDSASTTAPTTLFQGTNVTDSATLGFMTAWDGSGFEHPILTRTTNGLSVTKKNLGTLNSGSANQLGIVLNSNPPQSATLKVVLVEY